MGQICHVTGAEKVLTLTRQRLHKEKVQKLVKLLFSNLIFDRCYIAHQALLLLSQSKKYRRLEFHRSNIQSEGISALARGNLSSLRSLSVNDLIRYNGIVSLIQGNLTSLRSLSLCCDTIGDTSVRGMILANRFTSSLSSLHLCGNHIRDEGWIALLSGNFPSLTSFDLSGNPLGEVMKEKLRHAFTEIVTV